jgi:hypothetical protein
MTSSLDFGTSVALSSILSVGKSIQAILDSQEVCMCGVFFVWCVWYMLCGVGCGVAWGVVCGVECGVWCVAWSVVCGVECGVWRGE